jgi:hypothetical protein
MAEGEYKRPVIKRFIPFDEPESSPDWSYSGKWMIEDAKHIYVCSVRDEPLADAILAYLNGLMLKTSFERQSDG